MTGICSWRFSPYFERPELGFARRSPLRFYNDVYDLPGPELHDLAYYFDSDDAGITGEVELALQRAIADWRRDYPGSSLFVAEATDHSLTGPSSRTLVRPRTVLVDERVTLGGSASETALFVARLRDLHTEPADVVWHASIAAQFDIMSVVHLPPPQPDGEPSAALEHWRTTHRPAMCYYRVGPGFIEVKDTARPPLRHGSCWTTRC